jgi:hypothetical protein
MYKQEELKQMLFIDIETTTAGETLSDYAAIVGKNALSHWEKKAKYVRETNQVYKDTDDDRLYQLDAALYPEFGKVVVITIGQITFTGETRVTSKIRSFYGDDEKQVLSDFMGTMRAIFSKNAKVQLIGHNIKGFDMPFLIKRSIINGVQVPHQFHLQKVKPWENCLLDTNEIWKFGGWNGASLSLICDLLQIPSPKENMYGGEVAEAYWAGRLEEIKTYCEADVEATMNVMLRMSNLPIIEEAPF